MSDLLLDEKVLMQTGVFSNRMEMLNYLLLKAVYEKNTPVGSWILREEISNYGIDLSTATIGRYLKELDYKGFTLLEGNQGRILTQDGKLLLDEIEDNIANVLMRDKLTLDIKITKYDELIDLLNVRQILETEAARLAAINATDSEIELLRESLEIHRTCVEDNQDPTEPALDFHAMIAEVCHNKFIYALLNVLIFEEKRIESDFETLTTRDRGGIYVKEHEKITEKIETRESRQAAYLMQNHIQELIDTIKEQAYED